MAIEINGHYFKKHQSECEYRLHQWAHHRNYNLSNFYKKPSVYKEQAYQHCCAICLDVRGYHLSVVSANTQQFVAAFVHIDNVTGEITRIFWITRSGLYYADVKEV